MRGFRPATATDTVSSITGSATVTVTGGPLGPTFWNPLIPSAHPAPLISLALGRSLETAPQQGVLPQQGVPQPLNVRAVEQLFATRQPAQLLLGWVSAITTPRIFGTGSGAGAETT